MKSEVRIKLFKLITFHWLHFFLFLTVNGLSNYLALAQNSKTLGNYDTPCYIFGCFVDQMISIKWTDSFMNENHFQPLWSNLWILFYFIYLLCMLTYLLYFIFMRNFTFLKLIRCSCIYLFNLRFSFICPTVGKQANIWKTGF